MLTKCIYPNTPFNHSFTIKLRFKTTDIQTNDQNELNNYARHKINSKLQQTSTTTTHYHRSTRINAYEKQLNGITTQMKKSSSNTTKSLKN